MRRTRFLLVALLLSGYTVFRSVSLALVVTLIISAFSAELRMTPPRILETPGA